jgi:hypothetical protein
MKKVGVILDTLRRLEERLGIGSFKIADHWEADLRAVGIASPLDPARLVYFAVYEDLSPSYYVSLEKSPVPGSDMPYEDCRTFDRQTFDELAAIADRHLRAG